MQRVIAEQKHQFGSVRATLSLQHTKPQTINQSQAEHP